MSDYPNSAGGAGSVRYINPDSLNYNPAFTNVVVVEGNVKTVHIGGQDAGNASGEIVGKGDIVAQTEQVLGNLDRKSTRLNSRHANISYAVFCLQKKNRPPTITCTTPA